MNREQAILLPKSATAGRCEVDSKTLLTLGTKTYEALNYAWTVLLVQASLLAKEVIARGVSEGAKHIEAEARETLRNYRMWREELTAIESEIVRRIWRNSTNGNFAKFKIGLFNNDRQMQDQALRNLQRILRGIPWTNDWFHPEGPHGMDSLTNLLLAKELTKCEHLDLGTTLEHAMNNKFAYLYVAEKRDFLDEVDKYRRRPFETYREVDEPNDGIDQAEEAGYNSENPIIENLDREKVIFRLREAASEEGNRVDQGILLYSANLYGDVRLLTEGCKAELVNQISNNLGVTRQYVRRRLAEGPVFAKIRKALGPTEALPRVILTDGDEKQ